MCIDIDITPITYSYIGYYILIYRPHHVSIHFVYTQTKTETERERERERERETQTASQPERELEAREIYSLTPRKKTRGASTGIKTK